MYRILTAIAVCALCILYFIVKIYHNHWKKLSIPHKKPVFFLGNLKDTFLGRKNLCVAITEVYKEFQNYNYKYVGFYKFLDRAVMICDPELIGDIMIKDFSHFADNSIDVNKNVDYILANNLFVLKGHHWKSMRNLISPMFTSGKKDVQSNNLNHILPLTEEVSQRFVKYVGREIDEGRGTCVEGKRLCTKFTADSVANCAFGVNGGAFEGNTEFVDVVSNFNDQSYLNSLRSLLLFMFPSLNKILKIRFFKDSVEKYLTDVVSETIRYRKENNIIRNDFLDQITQLKEKSTEYSFTDRDVVAQSGGFFIDGVETSASVMSYVLYEIARHPEVQKQLRDEIDRIKVKHNNSITYEAIFEMKYLDCVINESLRLNAPLMTFFKVCTKTYTLPEIKDGSKTKLVLNPGDTVLIPLDGLHTDPNYFSDPEKFKPERFFEENKSSILKNTYLPFGAGPRICIGLRFGVLQIKVAVVALLSNFHVEINEKMLPYEIHPSLFIRAPKKGFWFDFRKLTN